VIHAAMDARPRHWLADDQVKPSYFFRDFGSYHQRGLAGDELII
jgi:hypothetical protein